MTRRKAFPKTFQISETGAIPPLTYLDYQGILYLEQQGNVERDAVGRDGLGTPYRSGGGRQESGAPYKTSPDKRKRKGW